MARKRRFALWLLMATIISPMPGQASPAQDLAAGTCSALAARVDEIPGSAPVFLRSYDGASGQGPETEPALQNAAFTYDNALAAIALTACGRHEQALRIGEALLSAARLDRLGPAGRLRNAYRAGPQAERPIPPMGWWDPAQNRWLEDAYQVGTATGNVAWAALALLTLHEQTGERRFLDGATRLADWVAENTQDRQGPGGFTGGIHGFDDAPRPLTWKSTEHNTDLVALFGWLARTDAEGDWRAAARHARGFLDAMWDAGRDHFPTGTAPDGITVNHATSGLDAQLWPLLLRDSPDGWRAALAYAERAHGVEGGFDFNDDRDGLWVEGTAQAALVYRVLGQDGEADRLLAGIAGQVSPGGYLWATRELSISTGLAIGPDSVTDDFRYYRRPHLGATAWTALAALGWNPFTGQRVD
ncbi:hypothetical protein [Indioceanicola profundi]|uniref:hypothetical protein n=1 Tax=Indioceanicola profundi TaxID=2220096 RepID=UPI000E6AA09A|nr:hypothetical protein [Indioceanicola profundi]